MDEIGQVRFFRDLPNIKCPVVIALHFVQAVESILFINVEENVSVFVIDIKPDIRSGFILKAQL